MSYAPNSPEQHLPMELNSNARPSALVQSYVSSSLAANTMRAYQGDLEHFRLWGGHVPASSSQIAEYLAAHAKISAVATLERRLASLSKAHRMLGLNNPARSELVKATLRGIKRKHGKPQRQASPLTRELLIQVVEVMGTDLGAIRDKALLLIGFAGAFRRSELCRLQIDDISWLPEGITVELTRSKTDQEGVGRTIVIPNGSTWCPVSSLREWIVESGIRNGPIFLEIRRSGVFSRGLSADAINKIIKVRVAAVGLDPTRYSGHSLRAGYATSAAQDAMAAWQIKAQTGHRSTEMVERYIRQATKLQGSRSLL